MHLTSFKRSLKIVGIIAVLAAALGATIIGGSRAAQQFAKASTCPAQKIASAQVGANSAVVAWETTDVSQGRVEYGTAPTSLNFTAPEATSGKIHNVPLTLLTPNTVYYYLVAIGDNKCDSSGQTCTDNCVPYSFTTSAISPQPELVTTTTPTPPVSPTLIPPVGTTTGAATPSSMISPSSSVSPTGGLSSFCALVQANIGRSSKETSVWSTFKQYDIDGNGIINGLDVIKCQQSGK